MTYDVRSAVRQVVSDLLPDADVTWHTTAGGFKVAMAVAGEPVCTVYADAGTSARGLVAHVADVVQASAVERLGRAVPPCPPHAHPAVAGVTADGVAWRCPATGDLVASYALPDDPVAH